MESQIILLVGNSSNIRFTENELTIWDDLNKCSIGSIQMDENILDVKLSSGIIFIIISNKACLFSVKNLKHQLTIEDIQCNSKYKYISVSYDSNPLVLATNSYSNGHQMVIHKCKYYNVTILIILIIVLIPILICLICL